MKKQTWPPHKKNFPTSTTSDQLDEVLFYLKGIGSEFAVKAFCYNMFWHYSVERLDKMQRAALAFHIKRALAKAQIAADGVDGPQETIQ
jgi:hypothetical protein